MIFFIKLNKYTILISTMNADMIKRIDALASHIHNLQKSLEEGNIEIITKLDLLLYQNSTENNYKHKPTTTKVGRKSSVQQSEDPDDENEELKKVVKPSKTVKKKTVKSDDEYKPISKNIYFAKMYNKNMSVFDMYLTDKVKANIEEENKNKWSDLSDSAIETKRKQALYDYMKKKYDNELISMCKSYNDEMKKKALQPVVKEALNSKLS